MKFLASLMCLCLIVGFTGCEADDADASMNVSPGAISECGVNCECCPNSPNYKADDASLGAVGESSCSGAQQACPASGASLGAVSESSCSSASSCSKTDG